MMINPIKYHEKIKNEQHVFICAVSGRSSSTAFQRILNSSNKVWIWGEPRGIINQLTVLISDISTFKNSEAIKSALNNMYLSYVHNKHDLFYANAVGNLDAIFSALHSSISVFLKPWAPRLRRFGCKEIDHMPTEMLEVLKAVYPNSFFVFCFRNPLRQWPSLCQLNLQVSKDLDFFLEEYEKMANTYLQFAEKYNIRAFFENTDLKDLNKVKQIISYLNIPKVDRTLINLTVHSLKHQKLSKTDIDKILGSPAYSSYKKMQTISSSFYESDQR